MPKIIEEEFEQDPEKSVRKRNTRKKTDEQVVESDDRMIQTGDESSDEPAPRKRKVRTITRKTKKVSTVSSSGVVDSDESLSVENEKKPSRTRIRRKVDEKRDETEDSPKKRRGSKSATEKAAEKIAAKEDVLSDKDEIESSENSSSDEKVPLEKPKKEKRRGRSSKEEVGSQESNEKVSEDASESNSSSAASTVSTRNMRKQRNGKHNRQHRNYQIEPSITEEDLTAFKVADLKKKAKELGIDTKTITKKDPLIKEICKVVRELEGFIEVEGVLDILSDGYGFLRTKGYLPSERDCYVGISLIKRYGLRKGDYIHGSTRPVRDNEKFAAINKVEKVNSISVADLGKRDKFSNLTPIYPSNRLVMEREAKAITARVIDLVAPIGKGQRGLIVSPPKAGKTTILKDIAASISANNPEVHLMCLLVDERPEEVTDMERSINGEVISSTFDMPAENHIAVAELVIERAKRLVEMKKDVVILLDSITRLARAYNLAQPASGRVLSGGVDSSALYPPKRFLGAARNIEHGGSLTILASALIETGSKMDEVIFEEFKGTGNMELRLDRALADRRIFPAIDPIASGTRKEELLLDPKIADFIWVIRDLLAKLPSTEQSMSVLIRYLKRTDNNMDFIYAMARKGKNNNSSQHAFEL